MIAYYLFFGFFGLIASLDYVKQNDYSLKLMRRIAFIFSFFLICFFVGFRYKIATDWISYLELYTDSKLLDQLFIGKNLSFANDSIEPGYKILMSAIKSTGMNFFWFVFLITLFNTFSLFYFLAKNQLRNKFVFLSIILILTGFREFDILRQSIAFHIMLFAFNGKENRLAIQIPIIVLAMTFHYTAIIFGLFYLYQKFNLNRKVIIGLTVLYAISLFVTIPFITTILKAIVPLVGGVMATIVNKAAGVVEGFNFQRNISFTSLLNLGFLILLGSKNDKIVLSAAESVLVKMFLFYIIISIFFKEVQEVGDRLSYYFNFGIAFLFCLLPDLVKIREKRKLILFVPIIFITMRLFLHFNDPAIWYGQSPYRNYFFSNQSDDRAIMERFDKMMNIGREQNEKKTN